jgi:hypothetical protein
MRLTEAEHAMLAGEMGPVLAKMIGHQVAVGDFFGAEDMVPVTQAHMMADTESLGEAGVEWLERLAESSSGSHLAVPSITDPRGTDFSCPAEVLKQGAGHVALEQRAADAIKALGFLMADTCINYQSIQAPTRGEHVAFGDTGVVVYSNAVCGARSNFEGGPSALAAAFTGRTPRYGFHLDGARRATHRFRVRARIDRLDDWGALGAVIGQQTGDYWRVPLIEGLPDAVDSDRLKHLGAAMASYGSVAMFHAPGLTPEAPDVITTGGDALDVVDITEADLDAFRGTWLPADSEVDLVVFSAPQLSLYEVEEIARNCEGRNFRVPMLAVTCPQVAADAQRMGLSGRIEAAGGRLLSGMCFYQSYAREMARANGWRRLGTNSAKLANLLRGYGYAIRLDGLTRCLDAAERGAFAPEETANA